MKRTSSITANLMRGLTLIGVVGALIFAALDIYDVDRALVERLRLLSRAVQRN